MDSVFADDTAHCIAPVQGYIMPASESISLCSFTFIPISRSLQSPYKVLQFAGQSSTAISLSHCGDMGFFFERHIVADCRLRKEKWM